MLGQKPLIGIAMLGGLAVMGIAAVTVADTINIIASRDNTLIEDVNGAWSGGIMPWVFAGNTNQINAEDTRRGLVRFDLSAIPLGSTINTASVRLRMTKSVHAGTYTYTLHKVLADWGEGTSEGAGGSGAPSTAGSATWIHRFYPDVFWTTSGGDFNATASASLSVFATLGFYTWSSAQLAADVQSWLAAPSSNFGWILRGNETAITSAKRFEARETTLDGDKPTLIVNLTPPAVYGACCFGESCMLAGPAQCAAMQGIYKGDGTPCLAGTCCAGDIDVSGTVDVNDLLAVITTWGPCPGPPQPCPADIVTNGVVDVNDLLQVIANWGPCQ